MSLLGHSWGAAVVGVVLLAASGCSSNESSAPAVVPDASVEGGGGLADVTFAMSGHVAENGESFGCLYVQMPADRGKIAVGSAESQFTPGSHHFLVYRTAFKTIPPNGGVAHECTDAEQIAGITGSYYEAQQPTTRRDLPPGVAHVFAPGEVLLLTAHYLNTSRVAYDTHVDFRLHTDDVAAVQH